MLLSAAQRLVFAADAPTALQSNNKNRQEYSLYSYASSPVTSYLVPNPDGTLTRVEAYSEGVRVETYDASDKLIAAQTLPMELPLFGGFYAGAEKNFLVFGQENPSESDETEVLRVVRYSKDWQREAAVGSFGANTYIPFDAGSLRMAECRNLLYIHTAHEMYLTEDNLHHQASLSYEIRTTDMTIVDEISEIINVKMGYVSHSFNQFVAVDNNQLLFLDHGDAGPRSVVLQRFFKPADGTPFEYTLVPITEGEYAGYYGYANCDPVDVLPIAPANGFHYNYTGVALGGFEATSSAYVVAGNSAKQDGSVSLVNGCRNIFLTVTPKDDFTNEATKLLWITNYTDADNVKVSNPQLVKLDNNRLLLIWTEGNDLRYVYTDGNGTLLTEIRTEKGWALSDCKPVVQGNQVVWYVTSNSAPRFYRLDTGAAPAHEALPDLRGAQDFFLRAALDRIGQFRLRPQDAKDFFKRYRAFSERQMFVPQPALVAAAVVVMDMHMSQRGKQYFRPLRGRYQTVAVRVPDVEADPEIISPHTLPDLQQRLRVRIVVVLHDHFRQNARPGRFCPVLIIHPAHEIAEESRRALSPAPYEDDIGLESGMKDQFLRVQRRRRAPGLPETRHRHLVDHRVPGRRIHVQIRSVDRHGPRGGGFKILSPVFADIVFQPVQIPGDREIYRLHARTCKGTDLPHLFHCQEFADKKPV